MILTGCNGVPEYVIQPDKMAKLLADIHIAESAIDMGNQNFFSDSSRMAIKQEILKRYKVSADDLDTSFMWYGAHLDTYMEVYDQAADIIQEKIDKNSALVASQAALSVSGDSVDVWNASRRVLFSPLSSSSAITFHYDSDPNWEHGDTYTWRAKFIGNSGNASWNFVANYTDGAYEVLYTDFNNNGWQEMVFLTDSTRTLKNIYGILTVDQRNTYVYLDSVQMIRKRVNRDNYSQRYRQRLYVKKTEQQTLGHE